MCLFWSGSAPLNNTHVDNTYRSYMYFSVHFCVHFSVGSVASFLLGKEKACCFSAALLILLPVHSSLVIFAAFIFMVSLPLLFQWHLGLFINLSLLLVSYFNISYLNVTLATFLFHDETPVWSGVPRGLCDGVGRYTPAQKNVGGHLDPSSAKIFSRLSSLQCL